MGRADTGIPRAKAHSSMARAAALLVPLLALAACQDAKTAEAPKPDRPVLVERVRFEAVRPERSFAGTVRPRVESDLGFRVTGKVARRLVSVGDVVKPGQALATLDETDLRLQREQAEAERGAATAAQVQAQADLKRIQSLIERGWSTQASLDRAQAVAEEARGRLARAERAASLAQNALSYATLAADAAGVVTATLVEPGQVMELGKAAIRLARTSEKEVVVAVPEILVGEVREGRATVTLWSDSSRRHEAGLRELSPSADPATRTYQARYALPKADEAVRLGMTATVHVADKDGSSAARLPLSAIYDQGSGPSVWVIDADGRVTLRPVSVRAYGARDVLVASGVSEGDQVVTLGVQKLDAGQRVRIVTALQF